MRTKLTPSDIGDIIIKCKEAGVLTLRIGELYISFERPKTVITKPNIPEVDSKKVDQVQEDSLLEDEHDVRESQLSQLVIDDPVGYEQLISEGELVDAKGNVLQS